MGFELFLHAYEGGALSTFPLADAEAAFAGARTHSEIDEDGYHWRLEYPVPAQSGPPDVIEMNGRTWQVEVGDGCSIYGSLRAGSSPAETGGFMVAGPPAHADFWAALLRLLQSTSTALYWGGENALVIGRPDTAGQLPQEMVATLGAPFLATEPGQILARIESST